MSFVALPAPSPAHSCPQVHAPLRRSRLKPSATLRKLNIPLRPVSCTTTPLATPRDALPNGRITHRMVLTYKLSLKQGGEITPIAMPLKQMVYDGALEGHICAVYDSNKQRVALGDVYSHKQTLPSGALQCSTVMAAAALSCVNTSPQTGSMQWCGYNA